MLTNDALDPFGKIEFKFCEAGKLRQLLDARIAGFGPRTAAVRSAGWEEVRSPFSADRVRGDPCGHALLPPGNTAAAST